jgi:glutathione S-transferase
LHQSRLAYEAVRVERGRQTDPTYLAINPLGLVPALVTATHGTITEVPAVLSYIADVATGHGLLPAIGTPERYEALHWMAYLSSTVHPAFGRFCRAERFCDGADCKTSVEHAAATQLTNDFTYIEKHLANQQWVAGDHLTAADFHLFVFGRLGLRLATSTRFSELPSSHAGDREPSGDEERNGSTGDQSRRTGLGPRVRDRGSSMRGLGGHTRQLLAETGMAAVQRRQPDVRPWKLPLEYDHERHRSRSRCLGYRNLPMRGVIIHIHWVDLRNA